MTLIEQNIADQLVTTREEPFSQSMRLGCFLFWLLFTLPL